MLLSIITVCRNNLEELLQTYDSIRIQEYHEYEWIVVDGDSSDGTKKWLVDNSIPGQWVSEPDQGIYDAMNKGIRMSKGDYLIFMNSGDEFKDNHVLNKVSESIANIPQKPVLVFGDSIDVDESGNEYYRASKNQSFIKYGMFTQHQAMFFNRETIPDLMYSEDFKLSSDYASIARISKKFNKDRFVKLDFPICKFSMGGVNESKRFQAMKEDFRIRKNILKLSWVESSFLYFLHYNHAVLKHSFKKSRFIKHKAIPK